MTSFQLSIFVLKIICLFVTVLYVPRLIIGAIRGYEISGGIFFVIALAVTGLITTTWWL